MIAFQFTLFLVIGITLFAFHEVTGAAPPEPLDRLYPAFVWSQMPPVVAGIVVASILAAAMSNLSAALNSLASATVMDFYLPLSKRTDLTGADHVRISRWATLGWGVVLLGVALLARSWGSVLEAGLAIASVPLGALLGVFSLGVLTRRVNETMAISGMVCGLAAISYVTLYTEIAWTWYTVIGSVVTFSTAWLGSVLVPSEPRTDPGA